MSETVNNSGINNIKELLDEKKALYFKMLDENIQFAELKKIYTEIKLLRRQLQRSSTGDL